MPVCERVKILFQSLVVPVLIFIVVFGVIIVYGCGGGSGGGGGDASSSSSSSGGTGIPDGNYSIGGQIQNGNGAGMNNASVIINSYKGNGKSLMTNAKQEVTTDEYGNFTLDGLASGIYQITISKNGKKTAITEIELPDYNPNLRLQMILPDGSGSVSFKMPKCVKLNAGKIPKKDILGKSENVNISWDTVDDAGFISYAVYRSNSADVRPGSNSEQVAVKMGINDTIFTDTISDLSLSYFYRVYEKSTIPEMGSTVMIGSNETNPTCVLAIKVIDGKWANGEDISNATVTCNGQSTNSYDSGYYYLYNIPTGSYELKVSVAGYAEYIQTVTIATSFSTSVTTPLVPLDTYYAFVSNSGNGTINVLNIATGKIVKSISGFNSPQDLTLSPDKTKLFVCNRDSVSIINLSSLEVAGTISSLNWPWGIAILPNSTKAYTANFLGNTVSVINLSTNQIVKTISGFTNSKGIASTSDGTKVYVTNWIPSSSVAVIDTNTDTIAKTITGLTSPEQICVANSTKAYVNNRNGSDICVIDFTTDTISKTISGFYLPCGLVANPSGTKAFIANDNGVISVVDVATDSISLTISGFSHPSKMAMTTDGSFVYIIDGTNIVVVNTITNSIIKTMSGFNSPTDIVIK